MGVDCPSCQKEEDESLTSAPLMCSDPSRSPPVSYSTRLPYPSLGPPLISNDAAKTSELSIHPGAGGGREETLLPGPPPDFSRNFTHRLTESLLLLAIADLGQSVAEKNSVPSGLGRILRRPEKQKGLPVWRDCLPYSCISPWSAQKTRPLVQDWLAWPLPRREEVYGMVSRKAHTCTYIHSIGCPRNTYTSLPLSPDLSLSLSLVSGCLPPGRYQLDTASPLPSRHGQVVASSEQTNKQSVLNQSIKIDLSGNGSYCPALDPIGLSAISRFDSQKATLDSVRPSGVQDERRTSAPMMPLPRPLLVGLMTGSWAIQSVPTKTYHNICSPRPITNYPHRTTILASEVNKQP